MIKKSSYVYCTQSTTVVCLCWGEGEGVGGRGVEEEGEDQVEGVE